MPILMILVMCTFIACIPEEKKEEKKDDKKGDKK